MKEVSRALDDEHRATLDLLGRVEQAFARAPRPGTDEAAEVPASRLRWRSSSRSTSPVISISRRRSCFRGSPTRATATSPSLLREEHDTIRAVAAELLPLARAAAAGTLDDAGFAALKRGAPELVERLVAHIQKETMALLPSLDDLLDEDTDRELAFAYVSA